MKNQSPQQAVRDEAERPTQKSSCHGVNRPTRRRLKISGVEERTGVHRQTIWRWYTDPENDFPRPHYLGSERQWFEDEIERWEETQMAKRASEKQQAVA
jgi:predicted DNA-binding transcriptional regulator AlpA